jgi:hypothetical protein
MAAVAGAFIGWAIGQSIASGIVLPVTSFWARAQLLGTILAYGGAAVGAVTGYLLASRMLRR